MWGRFYPIVPPKDDKITPRAAENTPAITTSVPVGDDIIEHLVTEFFSKYADLDETKVEQARRMHDELNEALNPTDTGYYLGEKLKRRFRKEVDANAVLNKLSSIALSKGAVIGYLPLLGLDIALKNQNAEKLVILVKQEFEKKYPHIVQSVLTPKRVAKQKNAVSDLITQAKSLVQDLKEEKDTFLDDAKAEYKKIEKYVDIAVGVTSDLDDAQAKLKTKLLDSKATIKVKADAFEVFLNAKREADDLASNFDKEISQPIKAVSVHYKSKFGTELKATDLTTMHKGLGESVRAAGRFIESPEYRAQIETLELQRLVAQKEALTLHVATLVKNALADDKVQFWNQQLRWGGGDKVFVDNKTIKIPRNIRQLRSRLVETDGYKFLRGIKSDVADAVETSSKRYCLFTVRNQSTTNPFYAALAKLNLAETNRTRIDFKDFANSVAEFIKALEQHPALIAGLKMRQSLTILKNELPGVQQDITPLHAPHRSPRRARG